MIPKFPETENAISLPITGAIRHLAHEFAARQPTREKAEQVMLNTIAVSIVKNYLTLLDVPTDLASSDSWNPVMQLCSNVADLDIPGIGKLECRPVKSTATSCLIPLEVWDLRCGYVVVQIDELGKKAAILGFTPEITTEELPLSDLQPLESLIDRLHELKQLNTNTSVVNLAQWFDNIFDWGWQTIESLINPEQLTPALSLRSADLLSPNAVADNSIARAKLIDLGVQLGNRSIVLLVKLIPEENGNIAVTLRIHPQPHEICLPEALELRVLESSGNVFMEAQARSRDNYIQLQFSGQPQEIFTVEIRLANIKFTERFQL